MQAIAGALGDLNADVVAFQEAWTERAGRILAEAATRIGLVHQFDAQAQSGGSGLMVFSRHPITSSRFERYLLAGLPERVWHGDYWGGKGYAKLEIAHPAGSFTLFDTHLHAQYRDDGYPSYRTHRMGQIVQLSSGLSGVDAPVVAVGDFNMRDSSAEYRAFTGLTHLRDCASEHGNPQPTSLASNPYRTDRSVVDERIDYGFVRNGTQTAIEVTRVDRIFDRDLEIDGHRASYSDHAGLWIELSLRRQANPTTPPPDPNALQLARTGLEAGIGLAERRQRRERYGAVGGFAGGASALAARRSRPLERRSFLRGLLGAGAAAAIGSGFGLAALSQFAVNREIANYRAVLRMLDRFEPTRARRDVSARPKAMSRLPQRPPRSSGPDFG